MATKHIPVYDLDRLLEPEKSALSIPCRVCGEILYYKPRPASGGLFGQALQALNCGKCENTTAVYVEAL